jgi:hypothetical protein
LAAAVGAVGCGGQATGTVSGKVTYQDGPVKGGQVVFAAANGHSVLADIKEDGSYVAEKVPVGEAKIAVQTRSLGVTASMPKRSLPPEKQQGGRMSPEEAKRRFVQIPERYETTETSGLTYTVVQGPQQHDVPLKGGVTPAGGGGSGSGPPKK